MNDFRFPRLQRLLTRLAGDSRGPAFIRKAMVAAVATMLIFGVGTASAEFESVPMTAEESASAEPSPSPFPTDESGVTPAGGGGGSVNNEVVVINTVDGRTANRAGIGVARVTGDDSYNQNAAAATSQCSDCRTVAVAAQAVIIQRNDATTIKPSNIAIAVNANCLRCETVALAYQLVFTTDGLVRYDDGVGAQLAGYRASLQEVAGNDNLSIPEMEARIGGIVDEMWAALRAELEAVGIQGDARPAKARDVATGDTAEPSPSPSPSESPSESPSPSPTSSESPDPEPTSTESSGAEATPSAAEEESPSPEPSPSPSPSPSPDST